MGGGSKMTTLNQEYLPDEILDPLYEARGQWERAEWLITARVMARVGIDDALDDMNAYICALKDFEETFGE